MNIDLDRGVIQKIDPLTGAGVFMYVDDPGVFLNAFGTPVTDALAAKAGYDVERLGKARLRTLRLKQAATLIEAEFAEDVGDTPDRVVEEAGGFTIVDRGHDRYIVKDPDGGVLTPMPLPKDVALGLLRAFAPTKPAEPAPSTPKAAAPVKPAPTTRTAPGVVGIEEL